MPCFYFKYTPAIGAPLYLEDEPIKWDAVKIKLKRDIDWHGVNYEYTDADIPLEFDCLSGSEFIEQIYQSQGSDGYIGFEFGYYDGIIEIPEYEGKINLSTRKLLSTYRISATVEKAGLHDLIKTRWSTKADLFAKRSIDGVTLNNPDPITLNLHSKVLINNYNKTTDIDGSYAWQPFLGDQKHDVWFVFDTIPTSDTDSNIDATIGSLLGPTGDDPVENSLALLFDLNSNGAFTFNISLSYSFNIKLTRKTISPGKPKIGDWFLDHWLEIRDINDVQKVKQRIGTRLSGFRDGQFLTTDGSVNASASISGYNVNLAFGDRVYVYAHFNLDGYNAGWKGIEAYIKTFNTNWAIEAETTTEPSAAKVMLIHETLTQAFAYITNENNSVYSEFFGREDLGYALTGCGAYKSITNGFQIRKFLISDNAPKLAPQEIMNSLNAIFCIGMGYEKRLGNNILRIEDRGYFYQDVEILFIQDIGNYEEDVSIEKIYNNIQIGYTKYLDEGIRLLDEYNTEHQYLSPIINNNNPLDIRALLILSGYAIELTRRYQYQDTPKDSTKYDDDGFLICVIPQSFTPISGSFGTDEVGPYFNFASSPLIINKNDKITITGSAFNNGIYVVSVVILNAIYLNAPVIDEATSIIIRNLSMPCLTEKDDAFLTVTGVVSPETSYNLRHTPKRNLLNWAKWLNGGFYFKSAGDIVKNTFFKNNGELSTQFKPGETCPLGDINLDLIQEKADIVLAQFQDKDFYFIPEWITFKTRMTMEDVRLIRDCMTGADLSGRNYGYITTLNQNGDTVQLWIYEMTYNPNTQEVNFVTLKKDLIPAVPPSPLVCSDYADYIFADFEALPDLSPDIEQCRFVNFN